MPENVTETERVITSTDMLPMEVRMKLAANAREKAIASGKSPKDIEWESFIKAGFVQNDLTMAKQHLANYIGYCLKETNDIEGICQKLFLDFTQGSNGVRKSAELAEYVISRVGNTRNVELLQMFVSYYERLNNISKAESLYYTLYEIYANGIGVAVDKNKAITYLKASIKGNNTEERRSLLRRMYENEVVGETANKRSCIAYEKVIKDDIPGASKDYAIYLINQDKRKEAVGYFVADEDYESAYQAVNIKNKAEIDNAVKAFESADEVKGIKKSLKLMQTRYSDLRTILFCTMPASGLGMILRYMFLSWIYVPYHTFKLSPIAFILALVVLLAIPSVLVFAMGQPQEIAGVAVIACMAVWLIVLICVDMWRKYRFAQAKDLWNKLIPHPQLESRRELFDDEIISQNNAALKRKIVMGMIVSVVGALGAWYGVNKLLGYELVGVNNHERIIDKPIASDVDEKMKITEDGVNRNIVDVALNKIEYKSFTDKTYGFYFEYPETMEDIKQENTQNGTKEVSYDVKISDNALVTVAVEFCSDHKGKVKGDNIKDISDYLMKNEKDRRIKNGSNVEMEKLDDVTYIIKWDIPNNRAKKMIAKRCFIAKGKTVQDQYICLSYGPDDFSETDEVVWNHMLNVFKPGK